MEDGPYRAQRPTGGRRRADDDVEDILARHGLLGAGADAAPPGGRAARRRAEEEGSPAHPGTVSGRRPTDYPPPGHPGGTPPDPGSRSGRRHRSDDAAPGEPERSRYPADGRPERPRRNGYAADDEWPRAAPPRVDPPFDAVPPATGGGRRRAPDAFDAPPAPDATTALSPTGHRSRRRADPPDDAAWPDGASRGRRHPAEADDPYAVPPAGGGRRRAADDPGSPAVSSTGGTRRHRTDPDDAGDYPSYERPWPAEPGATTARPATRRRPVDEPDGGARRRRPEPAERPAEPPARSNRTRPPGSGAPATTGVTTTGGSRRRRLDPGDDPELPATGRREYPAEPVDRAGDRAGARRRHPGAGDDPAFRATTDRRRPAEPPGTSATTALPAAPRRRAVEDPDAPATTALPTGGTSRRRHLDPTDDPDLSHDRRQRPAEPEARRRHLDHADGPDLPTSRDRRRPAEPPDTSATTALPAAGRRVAGDDLDAPATTALPVEGSRRRRPDDEPPATTALPTAARSRRDAMNPEATVAVSAAEAPAVTTRGRATRPGTDEDSRSDRDADAHTRAMRIDETLTRLTAAHAGVTLAVTDQHAPKPTAAKQRLGPAATAVRLLAGALAVVVLGATAFGWGGKTWLGSAVRDAAALDPGSSAVVDAAAQSGDENVLVVATEPASDTAEPRADTVAVAHIPDSGGPVTVLAFPLDLEINRPPCEAWDAGTATYRDEPEQAEARTQLVSALDVGGPRCVTRVVQQLSGLAITKYVGIDLASVPALTDAVGGAEVCVPRPVLDGVLGPVVPDAGPNRLAGVRVADFVQAGDVEGEPAVGVRADRASAAGARRGAELGGVGHRRCWTSGGSGALRPTLADTVLTDGAGIDQVLALAMTLRRLDADGVRYASVPTGDAERPRQRGAARHRRGSPVRGRARRPAAARRRRRIRRRNGRTHAERGHGRGVQRLGPLRARR